MVVIHQPDSRGAVWSQTKSGLLRFVLENTLFATSLYGFASFLTSEELKRFFLRSRIIESSFATIQKLVLDL